ncbi:MAG: cytochrome c [Pseudomonadota bacterium]
MTRGKSLFAQQCAACHGADGREMGSETFGLGVIPPDLTQFSKQNGGAFPRDQVMSVIDGYYRREHYSNPMPVFGDGDMGPTVIVGDDDAATPIPADLLALANYLASIRQN